MVQTKGHNASYLTLVGRLYKQEGTVKKKCLYSLDQKIKIEAESKKMLDTPTTLRGGVNECGALFPKTSLLHKNSSISIQHLFITHCCHL
jgi:hypothetical protein